MHLVIILINKKSESKKKKKTLLRRDNNRPTFLDVSSSESTYRVIKLLCQCFTTVLLPVHFICHVGTSGIER